MNKKLIEFISYEKAYLNEIVRDIQWENVKWNVQNWLIHRGQGKYLNFETYSRMTKKNCSKYPLPNKSPLPYPFIDFVKAVMVNLNRTKNIGYASSVAYLNDLRRLYIIMDYRNEKSVEDITRWHFEEILEFLQDIKYKNIFDAATNLQAISNLIDSQQFLDREIGFIHGIKSSNKYYNYDSIKYIDLSHRKKDEKLPSYEALVAYSKCTNNPINDHEEILLRTLDLLMAMGLRGNEVTHLPYDCWVESDVFDKEKKIVFDMHGVPIKNIGIRYYAEKKVEPRIHWLANQDIPFAKRAVKRLKELTKDYRESAKWQEDNPNRLWDFDKDQLLSDYEFIEYVSFNKIHFLHSYLRKNGIKYYGLDKSYKEQRPNRNGKKSYYYSRIYKAGEVEDFLLSLKKNDHIVLKENINGKSKVILRTSDLLSIRPEGAFRFKRYANTFRIFPGRITLKELNTALGGKSDIESIFDRRSLFEADGSRIKITSHQPRHWRNTLYELAGMSNVQQALAMGRKNLDQNATYQHTTPKEKIKLHQDFLAFDSNYDKLKFLRDGIRNKNVTGMITDTYHS